MNVIDQQYPLKTEVKSFSREAAEERYLDAVEGSADGLRVSEELYWEKYYHDPDFSYEWNNGILEEKPMADYLSFEMYRWFFSLLQEYLKTQPIANIIGLDIGFRLALPDKTSIRRPDLALILHANPMTIADEDCTYRGIFDLCIEFLSDSKPGEAERDTVVKKQEYSQGGVQEYFILDRKGEKTAFYRLNRQGSYSSIPPQAEGIIRSEVLPGFQFRIEDLYSHPPLIEKIDDPVYKAFILPEYQAERQRTETERQEKLKFAAKLRELGIDPESL
ncbi:MAG: Uma2 family endonuclease [bacterium]|nr:Uma2 family endonuclease [bacterium]